MKSKEFYFIELVEQSINYVARVNDTGELTEEAAKSDYNFAFVKKIKKIF